MLARLQFMLPKGMCRLLVFRHSDSSAHLVESVSRKSKVCLCLVQRGGRGVYVWHGTSEN